MKIAVFGGSFNPPHFSHLFLLTHLAHSEQFYEIIVFPTYQHPFKDSHEDSYFQRFSMVQKLVDLVHNYAGTRITVTHIDIALPEEEQGKTFYQLKSIQKAHPQDDLSLVIGADIWNEVHKWYNWEGIREYWDVIIYGREDWNYQHNIPIVFPNISSTDIRTKIRTGEDISYLVPKPILDFIKKEELYRRT